MRYSLLAVLLLPSFARADAAILAQRPAVSAKNIAFVYAGDIWVIDRAGGDARRLTAGVGLESYPVFSPDGEQVAFAGEYEGNLDVYVVPTAGGVPRRLTHHPDPDVPVGWTPDGKSIVFRSPARQLRPFHSTLHRSRRTAASRPNFHCRRPRTARSRRTASGSRTCRSRTSRRSPARFGRSRTIAAARRRRSGSPISTTRRSPRFREKTPTTSTRCGSATAFTSSLTATGATTLFVYDPAQERSPPAARAGPAGHQVRVGVRRRHRLRSLRHAEPLRPQDREGEDDSGARRGRPARPCVRSWRRSAQDIQNAGLSPTGSRAVFEARGEILTVPAEKGDVRNLTNTPGAADRDPAWSPDGKSIAYFSDESGEYELHVRPQHGSGEVKKYKARRRAVVLLQPELVARQQEDRLLRQAAQHLVHRPRLRQVHEGGHATRTTRTCPPPASWSPDGKWLAYSQQLKNYLNAVFLYSLETGEGASDHRRHERRPRRRRSTKTASTSTSRPAPTSARPSARACRSSIGR